MIELVQGAIGIGLFIAILAILILVHEVGHFVTARRAGVRVHEFGVGFPPRARVLKNDGETLYTLNWLPIGGFVKLEGEDGDSDDPRSFTSAPFLVKQWILAAGVLMNLVLAFGIMTAIAWMPQPVLALTVGTVQPGSPAAEAGISAGSQVIAIDGEYFDRYDMVLGPSLPQVLRDHAGETVTLSLLDATGQPYSVEVTLRAPAEISADKGALGVADLSAEELDQTFTRTPLDAVVAGAQRTVAAFSLILDGLAQLGRSIVTDPTTAPPVQGPVGIAQGITSVFWRDGFVATLFVAGLLSANLALVNILPLPPLDGGRMLMIAIKRVAGARVSVRAEQATYFVGFIFLFAFLIWITAFDIARLGGVVP